MTNEERRKRRALIVRRWNAYRVSCAQREAWKKRRAAEPEDLDEDPVDDSLLTELPEGLLG